MDIWMFVAVKAKYGKLWMKNRKVHQNNQLYNLNVIFSATKTFLHKICFERESMESTQICFVF